MISSAIVSPNEDLTPEETEAVRDALSHMAAGEANAGSIAVLSKGMKADRWSVNPVDAQFLESRSFSVTEVCRWFRIPPHMVQETAKSTSWGTGIDSQTVQFQRFVLQGWTSRIESRLSRLLPEGQKLEFDYRQLLAGSPSEEIELLMKQTGGQPILMVDEARAMQNRGPMPKPAIPHEIPA
jgi:HK97 family phage portal protein